VTRGRGKEGVGVIAKTAPFFVRGGGRDELGVMIVAPVGWKKKRERGGRPTDKLLTRN